MYIHAQYLAFKLRYNSISCNIFRRKRTLKVSNNKNNDNNKIQIQHHIEPILSPTSNGAISGSSTSKNKRTISGPSRIINISSPNKLSDIASDREMDNMEEEKYKENGGNNTPSMIIPNNMNTIIMNPENEDIDTPALSNKYSSNSSSPNSKRWYDSI